MSSQKIKECVFESYKHIGKRPHKQMQQMSSQKNKRIKFCESYKHIGKRPHKQMQQMRYQQIKDLIFASYKHIGKRPHKQMEQISSHKKIKDLFL